MGGRLMYLSPGLCIPDEILAKFPSTRLMIAGVDSFKDDNYRLMAKLVKNKVDVQCKEFRLMPHGFLCYNIPLGQGMPESIQAINEVQLSIKELINI